MNEKTPVNTSDFLEERIKARPRNRKHIMRRALEVAVLAVLFGLVACVTMVFVSPILEEKLFPTPTNEVKFSEESTPYTKEEIQPEDMLLVDEDLESSVAAKEPDGEGMLLDMVHFLKETSEQCKKWLVEVDGVSSSVSWLESINTSTNSATGAIVADNGTEMLVLVDRECLLKADKIKVTFVDGTTAEGYLKGEDKNAGLAVVAVSKALLSGDTLEQCGVVKMTSSNGKTLLGNVVMAVGNPNGVNGSTAYGFVTANGVEVNSWDMNYKLITTDIYGAADASGFLVNLQGQLIGVINNDYHDTGAPNMITALGISELKKKVEHMSNAEHIAFLGVKGADVPEEAHEEHGIPYGAYVLGVQIDSPAMKAGIQAGDIIVKVNGKDISSMTLLSYHLQRIEAGKTVEVVIMRHSQGIFKESTLNIALQNQN